MTEPTTHTVRKHFVTYFSPGAFVAETTTKPIDSWNIEVAKYGARDITERHGATPYAFQFTTRARGPDDLDSKVVETSPTYFLPHCKVETLDDVKARNRSDEKILRSNMENNGWDRIVTTTEGWKWTQPLRPEDIVL